MSEEILPQMPLEPGNELDQVLAVQYYLMGRQLSIAQSNWLTRQHGDGGWVGRHQDHYALNQTLKKHGFGKVDHDSYERQRKAFEKSKSAESYRMAFGSR
jgi:hypothetical protein